MIFDTSSIIFGTLAIAAVYVACLFFLKPLKMVFRLCLNIAFGGAAVYVINLAGGILGIKIGLYLFTSAVAGFMGIPGVLLLYAVKTFL